jgi:hypothetical protein
VLASRGKNDDSAILPLIVPEEYALGIYSSRPRIPNTEVPPLAVAILSGFLLYPHIELPMYFPATI